MEPEDYRGIDDGARVIMSNGNEYDITDEQMEQIIGMLAEKSGM